MPAAYPAAIVAFGKTGFHNTSDLGTSTCPGGATATALSITIADAGNTTPWPTANFVVYIPSTNELIFVTSRAGNVLTVAAVGDRGFGGTNGQAIGAGAEVRVVAVSEFLQQMALEHIAEQTALGVNLGNVLPNVLLAGISIGIRQKLNFIQGANVTLTIADNPGAGRVDLTIAATAGITGTGTAGQVTFWTGASAVGGDNAHFWDNTNKRLGIGTAAPLMQVDLGVSSDFSAFKQVLGLRTNANSRFGFGLTQNASMAFYTPSDIGAAEGFVWGTINAADGTTFVEQARLSRAGILTLPAYGGGGGVVSVGAADSGGAGFKLLRVPN